MWVRYLNIGLYGVVGAGVLWHGLAQGKVLFLVLGVAMLAVAALQAVFAVRRLPLPLREAYGLFSEGRHAEAAQAFERALIWTRELPDDKQARSRPLALLGSAATHAALDRFEEALADFQEVLRSNVGAALQASAWLGMGAVYQQMGRCDDALTACQRAADLKVQNDALQAYIHNNTADALAEKGVELDRALLLITEAIHLSPKREPPFFGTLGWVHFKRGELEAARQNLQLAIDLMPPAYKHLLPADYYRLGCVYQAMGERERATAFLQKAIATAPDTPLATRAQAALQEVDAKE